MFFTCKICGILSNLYLMVSDSLEVVLSQHEYLSICLTDIFKNLLRVKRGIIFLFPDIKKIEKIGTCLFTY